MEISSTRMTKPVQHSRSASPAPTQHGAPKESFTFSDGRSLRKRTLPLVAAAGAGLLGYALGSQGGWTGALAAAPSAAVGLVGGGALGLLVDQSEFMTGDQGRVPKTAVGLGLGALVAATSIAGGVVGGTLGGSVVGASSGLLAAAVVGVATLNYEE